VLADVADSDDDGNDNDNDKDRESFDVNGGGGVMSLLSCLDNELSSLKCLNDVELNVFGVDDILIESIASMLAVDDADEGEKDKKNDDDDNQRQR
jgi:hypothetical protein